jgi:hypothetical protein
MEPGLGRKLSEGGRALAESFHWSAVLRDWEKVIAAGMMKQSGNGC